jgi:hypothetical protein
MTTTLTADTLANERNAKPTITRDNAFESDLHRWVTEASDLGLAPGDFPLSFNTTLGNGQPFYLSGGDKTAGGDIAGVRYRQGNGILSLLVIND